MTTIQQQIDFIVELRESYDSEQRERIVVKHPADKVAELLRDINDSLHGMRLLQLNPKEVEFCSDCNQALTPHNRVNYAAAEGLVIVGRGDHVCDRCTEARIERVKHSTAGIP